MNISIEYWGWIFGISYVFWILGKNGIDKRDLWASRLFSILVLIGVLAEALSKWFGLGPNLSSILWMVILGILLVGGVPGLRYRTDSATVHTLAYHGGVALCFAIAWTIVGKMIM
jgi:fatty acid desaturase